MPIIFYTDTTRLCIFAPQNKTSKMRKTVFLFIALISFIEIYGQNKAENSDINRIILHENRFDKLIDLAELYMETNPEFAFNCAYKANEIAVQTNDTEKSAYSKIIIGNIFNKSNTYSIAVSYYENAIKDYLTTKNHEYIHNIYIKIAKIYQNNEFDSKWSVDAMEKALNYAMMTNNKKNIIDSYMAYAEIQLSHGNYKDALKYYNEILLFEANKNTYKAITQTLTNIADIKIKEKKYQEALTLIDSSLKNSKYVFDDITIKNYGLKGCVYDSLRETDSAKLYYKKAINLAYASERFNDCANYMYILGDLNIKLNHIDKAIYVFKILSDSTNKYNMYEYCHNSYYKLSECHALCGEFEEAYAMFHKYNIKKIMAENYYQKKKIKDIHSSYLLSSNIEEIKAKEIETNKVKNYRKNIIIIISGSAIILISSIVILILFIKNKNLYHKSKETAYEQQLKIDKMENELMEIQLKNNKESLINLALHFKSYIEYVNPLKAKLKEIADSPENEIKNKIKNLYVEMQNNNGMFNNTENLHKQINEIYKDFIERLEEKYPDLTKSEKRLCTMLYIDMSSKEIAVISNTTIRSVETSRYRLRKKFDLTRDEDIVAFLRSI